MTHFYRIPDYPEQTSAGAIITRLLDGLGFRFFWATEGLNEIEYKFRPSPDCRSIEELIKHIWGLINWVNISVSVKTYKRPTKTSEIRDQVLEILHDLRTTINIISEAELVEMEIEDRPFWHIINGPLSDALTHVGQINSFRRLAENPVSEANDFTGTPPKE